MANKRISTFKIQNHDTVENPVKIALESSVDAICLLVWEDPDGPFAPMKLTISRSDCERLAGELRRADEVLMRRSCADSSFELHDCILDQPIFVTVRTLPDGIMYLFICINKITDLELFIDQHDRQSLIKVLTKLVEALRP